MNKRTLPVLESGCVRLRPLVEADLPVTLAWRNQDHIREWFFDSRVIAPEQHQAWYEKYLGRDDDFVFVIEETQALQRPVGQAALYHIDWAAGRAEFGRLMIGDSEAAGRGLAHAATALLVDEALTSLGMREVYLEVKADNAPARAIYRACGFEITDQQDGMVRMTKRREGL